MNAVADANAPSDASSKSIKPNVLIAEWLMKSPSFPPLLPPVTGSLLSPEDAQQNTRFPWSHSPLNQFMTALETPFINNESHNWEMEDPDLIPSTSDWLMMWAEITRYGKFAPMDDSFDAEAFLLNYFSLPPVFRLAECAIIAHLYLPSETAVSYYVRARKALIQAMEQPPTLATVQACNTLCQFALSKGQPVTGIQFLRMSLNMILELRLDVDPDDSPWLSHLDLTPRQKEERRRAFWLAYWQIMWLDSNDDIKDVEINCDRIKAPGNVMDPGPVFDYCATRKWECEFLAVIGTLRRHYGTPPKTATDLLQSAQIAHYKMRLKYIQSITPPEFLLLSESPTSISSHEEVIFGTKVTETRENLVLFSLLYNSSISVLHRPTMFLASLKSYHPLLISQETRCTISDSITQCFSASLRIIHLFHFASHMYKHGPEKDRFLYHFLNGTDSYFESVIVVWFLVCRMEPAWWSYIPISHVDFDDLRRWMRQMVDALTSRSKKEEDGPGFLSPITQCLDAMLKEINCVKNIGDIQLDISDENTDFVELGMQVLSIGTKESSPEKVIEPYAFLGLLGYNIAGGLRWKGRSEESWRLFWKLNG
ncbi:hypothetical protein BCR33DRAFT_853670 [Rhizoclosmatium globosum]|uniref:Xylanolytic transcriptional activator regulatory domain-containing protein n=1 Tax=Rhizoclosmatium globosum TaxID=329046 RepID=A0A1Y2BWS1_9FUNG|nr:hypothetical protein BCR33DRAFT_853670 [Rhizoclosmatium globosum]|eukprot:ORY39114.1 hypothetical protein BCR33DRAFT_853670 [Rhizoclosmatium globosum]